MRGTELLLLELQLVPKPGLGQLGLLDSFLVPLVLGFDQGAVRLQRDIPFEVVLISDILGKKLECERFVVGSWFTRA